MTGSPRRFSTGPLGSATSFRFLQLIVLLLAATAGLSVETAADISQHGNNASIGCALAAGADPALGLDRGMIPTVGGSWSGLTACWARYLPNVDWVPFAAVVLLVIAAAGVYLALPRWKVRRARLLAPGTVDPGGGLGRDLDEFVREAGVVQEVRFGVAPTVLTSGAVVFGTGRRPVVRLNAGLLVTRVTDRGRFRAVVLHELAHIRNRDVPVTYATVALWRVFVFLVLIPSAVDAVYQLAIVKEPSTWHFLSSVNAYQLIITVLIAMMVYLVRADVLRTRELYADVRADSWGAKIPAGSGHPVGARRGARIAEALRSPWRYHPKWTVRTAVLGSQVSLFTVRPLPMFATGLVVDLAYNVMDSAQVFQSGAVQTTALLAAAGLMVAVAGLALWRAVAYALAEGGRVPVPSGWATGWWLGTGIAAGELVNGAWTSGEWFPRHPETTGLLIVVTILLMAWAAEYARARLTAGGRGNVLAQALTGLIPVWLTLAFALALWAEYLPLDGWIFSFRDFYQGLRLPLAHPPVLVRIDAVLAALPGGSLTLSSLWWAVPLLWVFSLLLMIRARSSGLPTADRPRLRVPVRAGFAGGLACCAAGLAATAGVGMVRGLGNGGADLAAYEAWIVVAAAVAITVTAVCLAARPAGSYLLFDTLTACGLVALVSTAGTFLQTSVDGCLGPANALFTSHGCALHPALAAQVIQDCAGYTLGVAPLVGTAAAAAVYGIRRVARRGVPDAAAQPEASSSVITGTAPPRHQWVLAALMTAVLGLTFSTTLYASWPRNSPQAFSALSGLITPPLASPQTERLQLESWTTYGGKDLIFRVPAMGTTFQNLLGRLGAITSGTAALRLAGRIVPPACAQLQELAAAAGNALPVPVAQGQLIWTRAGQALRDGTSACHRFSRAHDFGSLIAADNDVLNAGTEADMLLQWIVDVEHPTGTASVAEPPGTPQLLTYQGVTLRFNVANLTLPAATAAGKAVPGGGRLATLDVESCVNAVPAGVELTGGPPENPGWTLLFNDGRQVRAVKSLPARSFDATPYTNPGNVAGFSSAGDCMGGLIAFDIPASERADPTQVMLAPRTVPTRLRWSALIGAAGSLPIIGTAQPTGTGGAWLTVTGYAVRSAAAGRDGRIATITVQSCGTRVPPSPLTAWSQWSLLLTDGTLISPLNSPAAGPKATPYPLGREAIGSDTRCQAGSIQFGLPATDSADSLDIQYNGPTSPFWVLTPAAQLRNVAEVGQSLNSHGAGLRIASRTVGWMKDYSLLRALAAVVEAWRGLMDQVTTADLGRATANPGWDVAQVINHSIAVTCKFVIFADGTTGRPRTTGGDFIGADHRAAFNDTADRALAAWRRADLRRSCHLPFGTFTAEQAAGINLFDLLAHGWDISQAVSASFVCPDPAWETGLSAARQVIGAKRDLRPYARELPAPAGAVAQVRFLRYLGRAAGADAPT